MILCIYVRDRGIGFFLTSRAINADLTMMGSVNN